MIVQRATLDNLLLHNVCEVRFVRRRPVPGRPPTRRMWCTKSLSLLNSTNGIFVLNYRPPTHPKQINEGADNLLTVWDIIMQDYRNINMDQCDLLQQIPANDTFWQFFNENIYILTTEQKISYMDQ